VPSLNLQPNIRGGTAKKITSSLYRKFVGATHKKKIKWTTKSKTNRLAANTLLGPSKRGKRRFCRNRTPSDTLSDSDTDLAVLFDKDSTEEEQDADCVCCTGRFSEDHKGEERIRCAKYFKWAYTLCAAMEEEFVCGPVRDKHYLVLSLYPLYLYFLCMCFVSFLCAFCVNYSPPQIRNTCGPN